jgi:DNA processing protein
MTTLSKIISLMILNHAKGIGRNKILTLIDMYGSAEKVVEAGFDRQKRLLFQKWTVGNWENDVEEAEKEGVELISYQDPAYPKNLLNIPDFPLLLYVKGTLLPTDCQSVALIGTRNATLYGKQMAEKMASEVAQAGICVVSGLARGIDTAAHQGALMGGGRTLAVIGSGLSHLYPRENRALAAKVAESKAVCLIESPLSGGGMITMQIGEKHRRSLFALPGRVDFPTFEGNHWWIKHKKAQLVEKGSDLIVYFKPTENQDIKHQTPNTLTPDEAKLFAALPAQEKSIEELVLLTQLPIMQLNVLLTRLVLKKVLKEFPGKIYKKN